MRCGGRAKLTLETKNVVLDESYVGSNSEVAAGNYVMIARERLRLRDRR